MGSIRRRLLLSSLLVLAVFLGATAGALDRAYREVRDPNTFRPDAYRQALAEAAQAARALR